MEIHPSYCDGTELCIEEKRRQKTGCIICFFHRFADIFGGCFCPVSLRTGSSSELREAEKLQDNIGTFHTGRLGGGEQDSVVFDCCVVFVVYRRIFVRAMRKYQPKVLFETLALAYGSSVELSLILCYIVS